MNLTQIFSVPADPSLLAVGRYDPSLVALSVAISIFASLMALHIAGQAVAYTSRSIRAVALASGTLALGAGIWSMHFIGMLAFNLCTQVTYDPAITIGSMLPSLAASFVALSLIARRRIGATKVLSGGVLVGAGIGGMHYSGMAAMQLALAQRYDLTMFLLSIVVAVVLAVLALWVRFGLINFGRRLTDRGRLAISAVVMGSAISGMHYTAMAAARFVGTAQAGAGGTANAAFIAMAVAFTTIALTVLVLGANGLIRYREMVRHAEEAKERAEQAAAARTAFLANMSHEIRTPMNSILGFTDVLLQSKLEPDQRRYLETVRSSGRSLLRLLNEILDTAKLDKGVVDLEMADFDLLRLIDELSSTLGTNARTKGIALNIRYDKDLPHCFRGDELRIRQILTNLISNAIKFTEAGSVTLSVEPMEGQLHFAVRDTGIGIAADRLQAIFDPFTQADVSMSRRFGGTGLGTTISKKLVELMGGRIWVESTPGRGTTFHVRVPLQPAEQRPQQVRPPRADVALPVLRILVADDVHQNLELLTLLLGKQGHSIVTVAEGALAIETAAHGQFDVILMDMQMPDLDGPAACRRIRASETERGAKRVPIIALTASVLEGDRRAAREAGMDGFASKPIDLYELSVEIARVLGLKSAAQMPAESSSAELRVLDSAGGLSRWAGEQEAYHRALRRFAVEQVEAGAALQRLHAAGDAAGARALTHRVKGLSANLGLQRLAAVLDRFERSITSGQTEEWAALAAQASGDLEAALQAIHKEIRRPGPASAAENAPRPLVAERLRNLGSSLMNSLSRGELDEAALAELTAMLGGHVEAVQLARLSDAIGDFDFDSARSMVASMLEPFLEARQPQLRS